jgi:hypothetical protein
MVSISFHKSINVIQKKVRPWRYIEIIGSEQFCNPSGHMLPGMETANVLEQEVVLFPGRASSYLLLSIAPLKYIYSFIHYLIPVSDRQHKIC